MAQSPPPATATLTEEAFLADREKFWGSFTSFTTGAAVVVVLILIGLAVFVV